ncbi:DUF4345 family protein [Mesobacterium sp. TK19101]|uniref:DUF4345 family protein n=1 Tax=Mesobacterium hydrothermale TaxID=3111907 RepID=A0ABU6HCL0_9RHOB|nr:DUF4345 family protein [Mesobacterium sp. TK19101]MEC3860190.1 DUF4345 family protein [Mesobacterium sp. TK19101]
MMEIVNIALAALTVGLGGFGFLAPRFTASALDLETRGSTMGLSELRASAGGLFVALGLACLLTGAGWLYAALGVAYAGAATGRAVSIAIDRPPMPKAAVWFAFEALPATWLIAVNWP